MSPVVKMEGQDFETYFRKRFSRDMQNKLRKKKNKLCDLGSLEFGKLNNTEVGRIFQLHDQRWKRKIDTSGFSNERSKEFFSRLALDDTLSFKAVVNAFCLNERLISFHYGFIYNGRFLLYRSAHDDLFSLYSLGRLLIKESISQCFSNSIRFYDMGTGYEPYKFEWTDDYEVVKSIAFSKPNFFSRVIFSKYLLKGTVRDFLKRFRWIVLLKRNTLGELKYYFSKGNLKNICANAGKLLRKGIKPADRRVYCKRNLLLLEKKISGEAAAGRDPSYSIKAADIDSIDALAQTMDCSPERIVKMLYQKQKCFIACREGKIVHYSWVSFLDTDGSFDREAVKIEKNCACLYDCFTDKAYENSDAAYFVLLYICNFLFTEKKKEMFIITDEKDLAMKNAAYRMGFRLGQRLRAVKFGNRPTRTNINPGKESGENGIQNIK